VDVNTNEGAATDGAQRQRGACVVAQDVEADGEFHGLAYRPPGGGHRGDDFGSDVALGEGDVAEVLDEERMGASALIGASIVHGELDERVQVALPARRARQRPKMDHADEQVTGDG
jgi:hypothetical protein